MAQLFLEKLQLENFRNLENNIIEFVPKINCIFGNNGNGKTNLIEAIYYLINRKSFRKNTGFPQIISVESENPELLFSAVFRDENIHSLSGKVNTAENNWFWDNKPFKRKRFIETIFVGSTDSFSFHHIPSFRRNWFDTYFGLLSPDYKKCLTTFTSSLRFRNNLLSNKPSHYIEQIKANENTFIENSMKLLTMRETLLTELEDLCTMTFKLLFDESHNLEIKLASKFTGFSKDRLRDFYNDALDKDIVIGHTKNGVHRDDYLFEFDGFNSFEYCSLGQQKMSFLSLLFAYIELFRYKFKTYPLILLDDVSGELDESRWKNLIGYLQAKNFQVFITTANESFKKELEKIEDSRKIFLSDGNMEVH